MHRLMNTPQNINLNSFSPLPGDVKKTKQKKTVLSLNVVIAVVNSNWKTWDLLDNDMTAVVRRQFINTIKSLKACIKSLVLKPA